MILHPLLLRALNFVLTGSLAWLAKKILPDIRALWAGMRPLSPGDTVISRDSRNYEVLERKGKMFGYVYKLVDIKGINPFLLPALPHNPDLTRNAPVFWYRGRNGRCYLRKTGHPELSLSGRC